MRSRDDRVDMAERRSLGNDRTASTEEPSRRSSGRRQARHQRHSPWAAVGLSLAGLPVRVRSRDDDLQPSQQVECPAHRQVVGRVRDVDRFSRAHGAWAYAAQPMPATWFQVWKAPSRAERNSTAVVWSRRRGKRFAMGSWTERKRWTCRGDLNRFMIRSRRRVG